MRVSGARRTSSLVMVMRWRPRSVTGAPSPSFSHDPGTRAGSHVSGSRPSSPATTASGVPWPTPVAPSEPHSTTRSPATVPSVSSAARVVTNAFAARIGPTVCELDGPTPTENRSRTET